MTALMSVITMLSTLIGASQYRPFNLWCPNLITRPSPRTEAYNIKFAAKLAREVRRGDAGKVTHVVQMTL